MTMSNPGEVSAEARDFTEGFLREARNAWVTTPDDGLGYLHAMPPGGWDAAELAGVGQGKWELERARLACGITAGGIEPAPRLVTPRPRCEGCCAATGMPPGDGSPRNDGASRRFLGLPPQAPDGAAPRAGAAPARGEATGR